VFTLTPFGFPPNPLSVRRAAWPQKLRMRTESRGIGFSIKSLSVIDQNGMSARRQQRSLPHVRCQFGDSQSRTTDLEVRCPVMEFPAGGKRSHFRISSIYSHTLMVADPSAIPAHGPALGLTLTLVKRKLQVNFSLPLVPPRAPFV